MKTGETIIWDKHDRNFASSVVCSSCLDKALQNKCNCTEVAELEAAVEVLARKLSRVSRSSSYYSPWRCPSNAKYNSCSGHKTDRECAECIKNHALTQGRKNINRKSRGKIANKKTTRRGMLEELSETGGVKLSADEVRDLIKILENPPKPTPGLIHFEALKRKR